ncbi:hypothetical protein [Desulfopila inferna]|uniref:hypothetical protein n=1 Tax=Desulfopila inferna TaxID=468528 RepID=UPI001963A37D|nr:hypothetical protein [Desulfopila inferna]MBM9606742.1 hypothetical protein [Desulfopila inferna]
MSKCIRCGKDGGWTAYNYAGYILDKDRKHFSFPSRIDSTILPGQKGKDFLCSDCAGKIPIMCKVHGNFNYGDFSYGKQPKCKGCDLQLEIIKKNEVPSGFKWILPVSEISQKCTSSKKGWVALSDDQQIHVVSEDNELYVSGDKKEFCTSIGLLKDENPAFILSNEKEDGLKCTFDFSDDSLLRLAMNGSQEMWFEFWRNSLAEKLGTRRQASGNVHIIRLSWATLSDRISVKKQSVYKSLFCAIEEGKLKTFPVIPIPSIDEVVCWRNTFGELIEFKSALNDIPQIFSFDEIIKLKETKFSSQLLKNLPKSKEDTNPASYNINNMVVSEITCFPEQDMQIAILETQQNSLIVNLLPNKKVLNVKTGYSCNSNLIAYTDCKKVITAKLTEENCKIICSHIETPSVMSSIAMDGAGQLFFTSLMDKDSPERVHVFSCTNIGCNINGQELKHSDQVRLEKKQFNGMSQLSELRIYWERQSESHSVRCVAPTKLTDAILERWETERSSVEASQKTLPQLYKEYNQCKKDNLLYVLFVDIFLLNRELNSGLTLNEIANELSGMSGTELYENHKDLLKTATNKILLVSEIISNLKQKYEYLSLYYPYYVLQNESDWVSSAFGSEVASHILEDERTKVTQSYRERVRYVQGELRRILGEVERCIAPTKSYFNRDVIKSTTSSKIARHIPAAGQAAMIGIDFAVTGGMSSVLVGMFGIGALGKTLGFFQENKESAQSIKSAFEELTPWWSLFMNSLSVIVYETEQFIEKDNVRCMQRDKLLLDRVPEAQKNNYLKNMTQLLQKKIVREKHSSQLEVIQNSGVTIDLILNDITKIREIDMPTHVNGFIDSLNFTQRRI